MKAAAKGGGQMEVAFDLVEFDSAKLIESADKLEAMACMVQNILGAAIEKLAGEDSRMVLSGSAMELASSLHAEAEALEWLSQIYRERAGSEERAKGRCRCKGKSRKGEKCDCGCKKKTSWERPRDAKGHFLPLPKGKVGKKCGK